MGRRGRGGLAWGGLGIALVALAMTVLILSPGLAQAGQGGGATPASDNTLAFVIIAALVVVIVGAGVGLIVSRRKR